MQISALSRRFRLVAAQRRSRGRNLKEVRSNNLSISGSNVVEVQARCEDVLKELLQTVKDDCPKGLWAQGVKLARTDNVAGESSSEEEIVLRVKAPGLPVAPTVVLYPIDEEWDCDCPSQIDTCAHVAAAIIALAKVREIGDDLPVSTHMGGLLV